jgi:GTPase Era involved in 16S rRNA processing
MLGCKVYLDLYVKVRPDWLNNEGFLREYGLNEEDKE